MALKKILMDSGPIITITNASLMNLFENYKKKYNVDFVITQNVKAELIDEPRLIKRFELEAIFVEEEINKKNISIANRDQKIEDMNQRIAKIANSIILVNGKPLEIVHAGEIETISYAIVNKIELVCIDERNIRLLIEDANLLSKIIGQRLHKKTSIDKKSHEEFKSLTKNIKVIRSSELAIKAVKENLFMMNTLLSKKDIIKAILWNFKLHGCTINFKEIEDSGKLI